MRVKSAATHASSSADHDDLLPPGAVPGRKKAGAGAEGTAPQRHMHASCRLPQALPATCAVQLRLPAPVRPWSWQPRCACCHAARSRLPAAGRLLSRAALLLLFWPLQHSLQPAVPLTSCCLVNARRGACDTQTQTGKCLAAAPPCSASALDPASCILSPAQIHCKTEKSGKSGQKCVCRTIYDETVVTSGAGAVRSQTGMGAG